MLLSVHITEVSAGKAMTVMQAKPNPSMIHGLRYADTWMTASFRTGILPRLDIHGVLLFAAWDDEESLEMFLEHPRARPYARGWRARLEPARSIGMLPGLPDLPRQERPTGDQPVAALTSGRVRANKVMPFILTAADAERDAVYHPGFIEGISLIRPPLTIGTFSLWRNARDMRQYAVGSYPGGHRRAMKKDAEQHFNHEMFFSRYVPYAAEGQWRGRNPLAEPASAGRPKQGRPARAGDTIGRDFATASREKGVGYGDEED